MPPPSSLYRNSTKINGLRLNRFGPYADGFAADWIATTNLSSRATSDSSFGAEHKSRKNAQPEHQTAASWVFHALGHTLTRIRA